ncbi:CpaF family protein [Shewanella sp. D64]|uniref:CpaF family protein n=1 Tax=unclassified Shewanella TaxID=196818 RepID=UPI0022BA5F01|nr:MULTISPECIES: CpaF family protein [unclassified Shewanella]MEC4725708.1 CpaF family protein [Shewanella sp. D64]MEC4737685.1 CpaF family protein [Shewanella sp. E94]WBJ93492.1 CpaF family protein [Shewanella sp. MTB7]
MNNHKQIYLNFRSQIFEVLDAQAIANMPRDELFRQIQSAVEVLAENSSQPISTALRRMTVKNLVDELVGLGPLQPLLEDDSINDIMVNGPDQIFYERNGKIHSSEVVFVNEAQLLEISQRIAARVGRRIDESSPMVDARLEDGSRVNIVIKPIAIDGTTISIRKFREQKIGLEDLVGFGSLSPEMARVLMIAARCRLNILISGGTGSGKTTLLNALSHYIADDERIITIEDAAELNLQQPHVVRLETRPASIENTGKIDQRDLIINSLRMRPDRIILGECRGGEAFEMLQAMNTGHDGSMSTLHANTPRDAISRVESMVMMANLNQPLDAIRRTIVGAVHLVIQVNRQRDGSRKIVSISEVVGLEGENVVMEELFKFQPAEGQNMDRVLGEYVSTGILQRSILMQRAAYYGLQEELKLAFRGVQ